MKRERSFVCSRDKDDKDAVDFLVRGESGHAEKRGMEHELGGEAGVCKGGK